MASWFIVWFPVAFGAMSLKIHKKDVTEHRIINSAKTKKKNCLRISCFTLDWLVRLTHQNSKNICGVHGSKAISS